MMFKRLRSVRSVLTLWYMGVLLFATVAFGVSSYVYLQRVLEQTLKQDMTAEVDWIQGLITIEQKKSGTTQKIEELGPELQQLIHEHFNKDPRNYIVVLASKQGGILFQMESRGQLSLLDLVPGNGKVLISTVEEADGEQLIVAASEKDSFITYVAFPEKSIRSVLNNMLFILSVLAPFVIILSLTGGWFLAGRALRPVDEITERAARITVQNLHERLQERHVDDELGRLTETFNFMIGRLEASFDQMKQFLLNVAHELRTPLTILRGESELALTNEMTRHDTEALATLFLEETGRMARIVDDLLTLAKADAGQIVIEREPVNLHDLIEDLYEDATLLVSHKLIRVTVLNELSGTVVGDEARLRQLFRILLSNAIQYTDASGTIVIRSWSNAEACVTIEDTGIGIPESSLAKIFDRFYRVDDARTREKGGTGLGLSLAKWIVESHGGSIHVKSVVGKGSTFTVCLPVQHAMENAVL